MYKYLQRNIDTPSNALVCKSSHIIDTRRLYRNGRCEVILLRPSSGLKKVVSIMKLRLNKRIHLHRNWLLEPKMDDLYIGSV